jgi:DNA-directed RNA polymerase subunit RPC12/RpoP
MLHEEDFLLDRLQQMIGEIGNEEDIQAILEALQQTDWTVYTHQMLKCAHCKQKVQRRERRTDYRFVKGYQHFCVRCEPDIRARATSVCVRCGLLFEKTGYLDDPCPDCTYLARKQRGRC